MGNNGSDIGHNYFLHVEMPSLPGQRTFEGSFAFFISWRMVIPVPSLISSNL